MSDLRSTIKQIQREVGVEPDGVFGPISAERVLHWMQRSYSKEAMPSAIPEAGRYDARTESMLATLDPKALPAFRRFIALAKATAATLGCDYIAISGTRTFAEQDALFNQPRDGKDNDGDGRTDESDEHVTNARGGFSNHNFGIALDFGVFQGGIYLDGGKQAQQELATKVHKSCSLDAVACGLEWGGDWNAIKDEPHFEISTGLSLAAKRELFRQKGSVL